MIKNNYIGFLALIGYPGSSFTEIVKLTISGQLVFVKILTVPQVRFYKIAI